MNDSDLQISPRVLTQLDLDRAVTVVTQAFHNNPLWCYLVPNAHHRMRVTRQFFRLGLRTSINNHHVFGIGEPLVGIASLHGPRQREQSISGLFSSVVSTAGIYLLLLVMNPRIVTFLEMLSFFRSSEALHHRSAPSAHYYLEMLAVHPHHQGQGYATRLLQPLLDQADREAFGTYTETMTPRNMKLYEHFGFYRRAQQHFPSTKLTLWALYRPPKRTH